MKFIEFEKGLKDIEQFLGKKIICSTYSNYIFTDEIISYSITKTTDESKTQLYFITKEYKYLLYPEDFKKYWGFLDSKFGRHLEAKDLKLLKNVMHSKKSNYDTLEKGYKEAFDKIINNFGVYYYPIFNNGKGCYEVNIIENSRIRFNGRKAYIRPDLNVESRDYYSEFKVNNLGKKFFISKEECEVLVNKLNGTAD